MGKAPCCSDKEGLKKGPWTPEEDQKLIDYIHKHGPGRWRTLPKNAGLNRCGKSCRLRWTNYLRPDIKRGRFSLEEEETIIKLHSVLGNKWSAISARLPGRTDNEIKNYWNTHIRKKLLTMGIDPVTHSPRLELLQLSSILNSAQSNFTNLLGLGSLLDPKILNLASALLSSQLSSPEVLPQKLQENQLAYNSQFSPNQFTSPQQDELNQLQSILQKHIQDIQPNTTSSTSTASLLGMEQFCPSNTNLNCQSSLPNMWQSNEELPSLVGSPNPGSYNSDLCNINTSSGNQSFLSDSFQNFDFTSLLSTPSSSLTPLNSSCITRASGNTEDERDSYCSNLPMLDTTNGFEVDGIL